MARATEYEASAAELQRSDSKSHQAYELLHIGFAVAPTVAGIDKFLHLLTNWDKYLAPQIATLAERTPFAQHRLMPAIGAIEIAAGILVALRPRFGAYVSPRGSSRSSWISRSSAATSTSPYETWGFS